MYAKYIESILDLYLARSQLNLEVYDVSNDDIGLRPKMPRVCDTPILEVERLNSTVTEAELMNFPWMWIPVISELSKPLAELALIYMQGRLNN